MHLIEISPNHYFNPQHVVRVRYTPESKRMGNVRESDGSMSHGEIVSESTIEVTLSVGDAVRARGSQADALLSELTRHPSPAA